MDAKKIVEKIRSKKVMGDEWFELREEIKKFLKEDHPEEEKKMFRPFGYLEVVSMMCEGIERRREKVE